MFPDIFPDCRKVLVGAVVIVILQRAFEVCSGCCCVHGGLLLIKTAISSSTVAGSESFLEDCQMWVGYIGDAARDPP